MLDKPRPGLCARPLKMKAILDYNFGSNAEITQAVQHFFCIQRPDFFPEIFLKLIKVFDKCFN